MLKVVVVAIICGIIVIYLKSVNSDLTPLALLGSGILLISYGISYLYQTFDFIVEVVKMTGIENDFFAIILKITGIGYLIEFGAGTIEDLGLKNLADKLVFAGKAIIIVVSLPVFYAVFNILKGIIQ